MTYYWLHGTKPTAQAVVAGYSFERGFGVDLNGFNRDVTWLGGVLSEFNDRSYLFLGGDYQLSDDHGGYITYQRCGLDLELDDDPTYDPPNLPLSTTGESTPTLAAIPSYPHYWTFIYRWRVFGGIPAGRTPQDTCLSLGFSDIATRTQRYLNRTYAEASPRFRTDTLYIQRPLGGQGAGPFSFLATSGPAAMFGSDQERLDPFGAGAPVPGPNYTRTQIAWASLSGPTPIVQQPSFIPGYRRSFFI